VPDFAGYPIASSGNVPFQELVMHWRRYAVQRRIPTALLATLRTEVWDHLGEDGEHMVVELSAAVLQHEVAHDRYEVPVRATRTLQLDPEPTSWFQVWKRDRLPRDPLGRWLLRHRPVRTRPVTWEVEYSGTAVVELTRLATYPEADVPMPERFGDPVMVDVVKPGHSGGFGRPRRSG
jgi:hypothetical protein